MSFDFQSLGLIIVSQFLKGRGSTGFALRPRRTKEPGRPQQRGPGAPLTSLHSHCPPWRVVHSPELFSNFSRRPF